ncbi:hypothetical protein ACFX2I_028808 [Malus domestica]
MSDLYPVVQGINLKRFTYLDIKEATEGFKEELGRGGFATVFKGVLASDNGKGVAVKRLDSMVRENDFEFKAEDEEQMILADWAYDCYEQKKLHLLIKNDDDEAKEDIKNMELFLMISFWCIQEEPSQRPTMRNVTLMLEGNLEVSVPPNPSSLYVLSK